MISLCVVITKCQLASTNALHSLELGLLYAENLGICTENTAIPNKALKMYIGKKNIMQSGENINVKKL